MLLLIIRLLTLDPIPASHLAARWVGSVPGAELASIARRESRGRWIGIHEGDRWLSSAAHRRALSRGWLRPWCPFHRSPEGMGTRGAHGLVAAYSLRWLGPCVPPEALDVPLLSAIAAARRAAHQCRRYQACDREARRLVWRGLSHWLRRREDGDA